MLAFFAGSLGLAVAWVLISGEPAPGLVKIAAGAGAGLALAVGLGAFMQAMVVGTITIVAPISATGVVIPIAIGIGQGEQPTLVQLVGIVTAMAGVIVAVRAPDQGSASSSNRESGIGLALLAAIGFGLSYWLIAPASRSSVSWATMLTMGVPLLIYGAACRMRRAPMGVVLELRNVCSVLFASFVGFGSVVLYAFATRHGKLPIVSVLASLFPVVTIVLAYVLLGERIRRAQQLGVVAVVTGVLLMTVG